MKLLTKGFAEILGLLCAEGCHVVSYDTYYETFRGKKRLRRNKKSERIEFYNKDEKLLYHYQELLIKEFNYNPKITKHGKINICKRTLIREIISYTPLGHLKWKVPLAVLTGCGEVKIAFLRGYFDGDGTASKSIRFFSTNWMGLDEVSQLLKDIGIKGITWQGPEIKKNRKPFYTLHVSQKDRETFLNKIKPISKIPK